MENAKRGKRIAELEECLLTAEERLAQVTRERDEARGDFAFALRKMDEQIVIIADAAKERDEALSRLPVDGSNMPSIVDTLEDDNANLRSQIERLRGVLHIVSLDECESTSSASEKVHAHARQARIVLNETLAEVTPSDEARAEVERLRAEAERWERSCNVFRERDWPKAFQATVTSLEREVSDAYEQLAKLRKLSKPWEGDAYRRGAEAMRKAAVAWLENNYASIDAEYISALPIPEEL